MEITFFLGEEGPSGWEGRRMKRVCVRVCWACLGLWVYWLGVGVRTLIKVCAGGLGYDCGYVPVGIGMCVRMWCWGAQICFCGCVVWGVPVCMLTCVSKGVC